jgi:C4-type Zn-finger protein
VVVHVERVVIKLTLKNMGRKRKKKFIKCFNCGNQIELREEDIETIHAGNQVIRSIYCNKCGEQNIISK